MAATESVESVQFSFLTDEEVKSYSVKRITNPHLLDDAGRPIQGGLYDPALGPSDEASLCKSCGLRSYNCPGHSGHIDLVLPVYNPLLFELLSLVLQRTCQFCYHFKAPRNQVEKCAAQLKLIIKGDIVGARKLDSSDALKYTPEEDDSDGSHMSHSTVHSAEESSSFVGSKKPQQWTSLQFAEAKRVLATFLMPKFKECKNCEAKNPRITRPIFGWFHMSGMTGADSRRNVIKGVKLVETFPDADDNQSTIIELTGENVIDQAEISSSATKKRRKGKEGEAPKEFLKQKSNLSGSLLPSRVRDILALLWQNEVEICCFICDIQQLYSSEKKEGYSMFFLKTICVPPIRFRPPSKGGDSVMEHPQTALLSKVLESNIYLGNEYERGSERSKVVTRWICLQQSVNIFFDGKRGQSNGEVALGLCQLLEKKEGLFRQKMMGKRVNFACRSVISPDPYLAVNEIGIPPYFAIRLTYPERVTPWNVDKMRDAIINGPDTHPGATHYVDKSSTVKLLPKREMRYPGAKKLPSSRGVATLSGKSIDSDKFEGKVVHRHLQDGDIVLVNRQPTLHKPSIMAHVVRILKGEKTLRMHYANCSAYNADFDGDEMNVHFPQDEISRAEAYNIVNADNQYIIPTSGNTKRDLIQDHIISSVLLTSEGTFLTWEEYSQLLYSSGVYSDGSGSYSSKPGQKVSIVNSELEIQHLSPAIQKPKPLWTGKQVITAVLNHITRGHKPFTVKKDGKLPESNFRKFRVKSKKEATLLIRKNVFLRGVIDKAQFGKYGLVHMVHEFYGSKTAGVLLSVLSRLFTIFLQMRGFTCGVDDLLISADRHAERKKKLEERKNIGDYEHSLFVGFTDETQKDEGKDKWTQVTEKLEQLKIDPVKLQKEVERAIRMNGESAVARLDRMMIGACSDITTAVNEVVLPKGLLKKFPENCFSLMTSTGAKGGPVNFTQISSMLGQQELEGKRVPRMVSGKSLPCFPPWDFSSRSGGFISDCFFYGLRPQEYYFHCMAGREGLVDTAVKTSRSGYLQRCLVKNMECLKVCYDYTVRDADGSIIQFNYGEDGVDTHQTSFLSEFKAMARNREILQEKLCHQFEDASVPKSSSWLTKSPYPIRNLNENTKRFREQLKKGKSDVWKKHNGYNLEDEKNYLEFKELMKHKYFSSLAQPGEPVGVIAAQSIGEPSTQMTLNTFHFAGQAGMNVTLGIPRLQEILMTASVDIRTPTMTCPLRSGRSVDDANRLAGKLTKVTVADIVESMEVRIVPFVIENNEISSVHKLKMKLFKPEHYPKYSDVCLEDCHEILKVVFIRELEDQIAKELFTLSRISGIKNFVPESGAKEPGESDDDDTATANKQSQGEENDDVDGGGDDEAEDLGVDAEKRKMQSTDEMDYEDGAEDEAVDEDEKDINGDGDDEEEGEKLGVDEVSESPKSSKNKTESEAEEGKKVRRKPSRKKKDRAIFVRAKGLKFEVHFRFREEPHLMLSEIAKKAAKRVYIKNPGRIERCKVIMAQEREERPVLLAAGVDLKAFWELQDVLDINKIECNNIHTMGKTYGVEAAYSSIILQMKAVFEPYGISIDHRHMTLIADYMTHMGGYQAMSRNGIIKDSVSPFAKMSFETAAKFIVEAAYRGETDHLESPSSRICLGLPVKMGTGSFDLLQKLTY